MLQTLSAKLWISLSLALLIAAGAMRVQRDNARAELAETRAQVAQATQQAEAQARALETAKRQQADRIAHENQTKAQAAQHAADAAAHAADSLRDGITALDASPAPADPGAAHHAEQARTARELLATCADRYTGVAADADRLAIQVTGLQAFARDVCGAAASD